MQEIFKHPRKITFAVPEFPDTVTGRTIELTVHHNTSHGSAITVNKEELKILIEEGQKYLDSLDD